jgi:hypothetical protein
MNLETAPVAPANLSAFVFAGNATFTVKSEKTGTRFTFKVRQPKPDAPHFVSLLSGPDNENDFNFLGTVFASGEYRHGAKSRVSPSAPSAIAAKWVVERIVKGQELKNCQVWHEGKCGRCGRKLTVPESIETGLGPECASKMGI